MTYKKIIYQFHSLYICMSQRRTHRNVRVRDRICMYTHVHTCQCQAEECGSTYFSRTLHTHMQICMHMCIHVCVCVCVLCIHIFWIHIYIHTYRAQYTRIIHTYIKWYIWYHSYILIHTYMCIYTHKMIYTHHAYIHKMIPGKSSPRQNSRTRCIRRKHSYLHVHHCSHHTLPRMDLHSWQMSLLMCCRTHCMSVWVTPYIWMGHATHDRWMGVITYDWGHVTNESCHMNGSCHI